jgi:hypothetical protein
LSIQKQGAGYCAIWYWTKTGEAKYTSTFAPSKKGFKEKCWPINGTGTWESIFWQQNDNCLHGYDGVFKRVGR